MGEHHKFGNTEIEFLRKQLLSYYAANKRDLPWRNLAVTLEDDSQRAYSIWVSEIMLQQTQVATVIEYYNKWINRWPTVSDLSKATLEEVNEMWSGLGYYSRGRRLHEGAQKLSKLRGKKSCMMPQTARDLMKELAGVGRYTAGAVASIAYNQVTGIVDGNVIRVMSRLRMIGADMSSQTASELFWELANKVVDPEEPGDFNQSMMELGALICTPKSPKCSICPVKKICKAYHRQSICGSKTYRKITDAFSKSNEAGGRHSFGFETDDDESNRDEASSQKNVEDKGVNDDTDGDKTIKEQNSADKDDSLKDEFNLTDIEDFPECKFCLPPDEPWDSQLGVMNYPRKGKRKLPGAEKFLSVVIEHNNKFLFSQRPDKGLLANMWEFPLTEIEKENKEVIESSIIRKEMNRRFSFSEIDNFKYCGDVNHIFSHKFHIYRVYHVTLSDASEAEAVEDSDGRKLLWMSRDEANKSAITSAIRKIMAVKDCSKKGKRKRQSEVKVSKGQKTLDDILTKQTKN